MPQKNNLGFLSIATLATQCVVILMFFVDTGWTWAANSASFNCAKASSQVEVAICSDQHLIGLDVELADRYKKLRNERYPEALTPWLTSTQREWLKKRNSCPREGLQNCLLEMYSQRLFELELTESYVKREWGDTATISKVLEDEDESLFRPQSPQELGGYYARSLRHLRNVALSHDLRYSKEVLGFDNYQGQKQWEKYVYSVCNYFSIPVGADPRDYGSQGNSEEEYCYAAALAQRRSLLSNVMHALSR